MRSLHAAFHVRRISILTQCFSVLDLVKAMETACARSIPYKIGPRRVGDVASLYANPEQAKASALLTLKHYAIPIK